jgi:ATP-dependent Lon protease
MAEMQTAEDPETVRRKYGQDLERVAFFYPDAQRKLDHAGVELLAPEDYPMRLKHFEWAIANLERTHDVQQRVLAESLILPNPPPGVSHGLYATTEGNGGILTVQCSIRPAGAGEPLVTVTGQGSSTIVGQTAAPDTSVLQSAENAAEAVRGWLWQRTGLSLSQYHVHFQVRSIMEGTPTGVSGPSAGFALFAALVSEFAGVAIPSSVVMTGTIGVKMDVGPVGGLGGYGTDTGKLVGLLKTQRVQITDLVLPKINFEIAKDEVSSLEEENVAVHPVVSATDAFPMLFSLTEEQIAERIRVRMEPQMARIANA